MEIPQIEPSSIKLVRHIYSTCYGSHPMATQEREKIGIEKYLNLDQEA